ncbi:DUF5666 domain-containing protein [Solemya velum gill symbiont]|uniref:DUF5666 domain-containing protein n=1 Tax=Solemya velum gill symbiont TaxID=2340 RepID=A0A0B0HC98_SOVGS|nr:DUF5666 domain-containing protein [Solemya velum gill symbiont]KHF26685.1 hypothetical protein JV46_23380 [Solemya velum gill symbiont]OOY57747.1 hypothetical protein BOV99_01820 [Solemya velum gill symbiont]OOY58771.1 hypothetical protein BOW00_01820 [Solemya velum gill symbiont]OOY61408.1 hypothetical protein BOW02_03300 [Solemya velum gill symbiont]OOY62938.1 hypothetical protein BOW04_04910 [Solemya velum gill symbiont]
MKQLLKHLLPIILMASLSSCGGGGTIASGGSGGTGISTGSIGGFGSIFVNGIEFDISGATLFRDGIQIFNDNDFELGEVVTIEGSIDSASGTGVATSVTYDEILVGPVTTAQGADPDVQPIEVLGQTIRILPSTVLSADIATMTQGVFVEISGYYNADQEIVATSIKVVGATTIEAKLFVDGVDLTTSPDEFDSNDLTVLLADLSHVTPADMVQVTAASNALAGTTLTASSVTVIVSSSPAQGTEIELEGIITSFISPSHFFVNGVEVTTDGGTIIENPAGIPIALNVRVEVEGVINSSGVLPADVLEVEDDSEDIELEVFGQIGAKIDPDTLVVQGTNYVIVLGSDLHGSSYASLNIGDWVHIHAEEVSGEYIIEELELKAAPGGPEEGEIEGTVTDFNEVAGWLVVNGTTINTDSGTVFRGPNENVIPSASFFDSIAIGSTEVHAIGAYTGGVFEADDIRIDD